MARIYADSIHSRAVFVVDDGYQVAAWGAVDEKSVIQSARKSFMSALYGIFVEKGDISLDATMADLGIDDVQGLTPQEKQATVQHLLMARSGIYHPSAASGWPLPERDTYLPGTHWVYNNWDFNALLTIFHQQTGRDYFETVEKLIAVPLQMEDWTAEDGFYQEELHQSKHPAYHMFMNARDMARFGLLFLRNGRWGEQQIIPGTWVEESTRQHSDGDPRYGPRGYGYMWWVEPDPAGYSARGGRGHILYVVPAKGLVIVHRVDMTGGPFPRSSEIDRLVQMIAAAKQAS